MIRDATFDDAPAIGRVHVQAWQHAYRGLLPDTLLDGLSAERRTAMWEGQLRQKRPDCGMFVAEISGEIVGFSNWRRMKDGSLWLDEAELETLYLLPGFWGQRLGYQLFEASRRAAQAAACTQLGLWVLEDNVRGIAFYQRVGMTAEPDNIKIERLGDALVRELRYSIPL